MNCTRIDNLTDRDLEALLDVAAGVEGASLEGLSGNGKLAVTAEFKRKGINVPLWYWDVTEDKPAPRYEGPDYEGMILARQEADDYAW